MAGFLRLLPYQNVAHKQLLNWRHFYSMPIYQLKYDGLTQTFEKVNCSSIKPIIQ